MTEAGWTEEEYRACPGLATRMHNRILDLQDENERLREALNRIYQRGKGEHVEIARQALND